MSIKLYALFGVVLIGVVIIGVSLTGTDPVDQPASPHGEAVVKTDPFSEAPSRENASTSVKETISHLRSVVANDPQDAAALLELATLLQNAHNPREAAEYYARGLQIDTANVDARIDYSLCLFETGRPREALDQNRIVVALQPDNLKALYNIGAVHANAGMADSARLYWSKVMSLDPDDPMAKQAEANIERLHGAFKTE